MKRDVTVTISLVMLLVGWALRSILNIPQDITDAPAHVHVIHWLTFVAAIRAAILWFQTLIYGIKFAKEENRVAVVLGHLFLGPIMSYLYYYFAHTGPQSAPAEQQ